MKRMPFLLLPLFLAANLIAQTTPGKQLTLKQAVDAALEKNIDILRAQNTLEAQQSAVLSAYGNFLPNISASGGYSNSDSRSPGSAAGFSFPSPILYTPTGGSQQTGTISAYSPGSSGQLTKTSYSAGMKASLTLFDGFNNTSSLNKASSIAVANEYSLYRTKQSIIFQTQTSYLQVLLNKSLLKVSEDNLKRSQQQLQRIIESNKVGSVAAADVYRQQVTTANDELALIRAQNTYDNSKADLLFLLSLDVSQEYDISDPGLIVEAEQAIPADEKVAYSDYGQLVSKAVASRPDYQAAKYGMESAESDVTIARSAYFPAISANVGYSFDNAQLSGLSDNKTLNWGISFSLPLFNGFQTNARVQAAKLALRNSEQEVAQTERQVQVDVRKAKLNFESAQKQLEVSLKTVISAVEDRRIAEERYNLGAGILLDLLTANANYTQALSNKVTAQYNLVLAKQQLKYVVGAEKY